MADTPDRIIGGKKTFATVTVTTEATGLSNIIDLGGTAPRCIEMSTAWTNADLTFLGAVRSTDTMSSIRDSTGGAEVTYTTTSGYLLELQASQFSGVRYLQIRSGTAALPVAQAAARTLYLGLTEDKSE